jgi:hypothetical protein
MSTKKFFMVHTLIKTDESDFMDVNVVVDEFRKTLTIATNLDNTKVQINSSTLLYFTYPLIFITILVLKFMNFIID